MNNRVKRAVIMAAGMGERMRPVTLFTPKPLVRVNGIRMIDTAVRGLNVNGITEVYVVVGYKKEQFIGLEKEYPGLKLIENPYYDICNNISSLYTAREHLEEALILDGDQLIQNPRVLCREFSYSGYRAMWTDKPTKEWILTERNGIVTGCSRDGGERGWQLFGISYWTAVDGRALKLHLEMEFEKQEGRGLYWDDVPLFRYPQEYRLSVYPMEPEDVLEIDSIKELAAVDESYEKYLEGKGNEGDQGTVR